MNMPVPAISKDAYQSNQRAVLRAASAVAQRIMDKAAADLRIVQEEQGCEIPGDCAVTYDATWMKRGHTSLHRVTSAIAWQTGQVLDYEVYSKFCKGCSQQQAARNAGKISEAAFAEWQANRVAECDKRAGVFQVNGSSGRL